jgi:hypothetical protein
MRLCLLLFFISVTSAAQVEIFGLRTYANGDEYRPPVIMRSEQVTIEFDVATNLPPDLRIYFAHASKDWVKDDNVFVNDPGKVRSEALSYTAAPAGVNQYRYRYRNSFPNKNMMVEFTRSGNYRYTIVDHEKNDQVLAEGRFIVTESTVPVSMTIENKYHSEYATPMNQMHYFSVRVQFPAEYAAAEVDGIFHQDAKTVDIIKNWDLMHPYRIDVDDNSAETFVENIMRPEKTFTRRDIPAGNEYRRMDLSSVSFYPNNRLAVLRDGPDVSRFQWQGKPDANGASKTRAFYGANSDYLEVEVRLRLASAPSKRIFIVGGFTEWAVLPDYEMKADTISGLYSTRFWVRRGVYDYQYVLGTIGPDGTVTEQDWLSLEGNDWRTINRYTALVYYHDQRYGGFDRVVGVARGRNPGGRDPGKAPVRPLTN